MYFMDYVEEEKADARKEGAENNKISTAINMLKRGKLTHEEISEDSGLPLEKVLELEKQLSVPVGK